MCPSCRSIILFVIAKPIPVPSYSEFVCNLLNILNILSVCFRSIPNPLSFMLNNQLLSLFVAEICIFGVSSVRYLIALPIKFWNNMSHLGIITIYSRKRIIRNYS